MKTIFVWKKEGHDIESSNLLNDCKTILGISSLTSLHIVNRYDVSHIDERDWDNAVNQIFSEPPLDYHSDDMPDFDKTHTAFAIAALPGQYDQRSDSARQCVQLLSNSFQAEVYYRRIIILCGNPSADEILAIKQWLINTVDSYEISPTAPAEGRMISPLPEPVLTKRGFIELSNDGLNNIRTSMRLAMSEADLLFVQQWFAGQAHRDPTETELRVLDTYWSDHCRHTTFNTYLTNVTIAEKPLGDLSDDEAAHYGKMHQMLSNSWERYLKLRQTTLSEKKLSCSPTLMDIATIGMKSLKQQGRLEKLDESSEINACTIKVDVRVGDEIEEWLVLFKNETHNHPTEIEPFGGAATCLGGAIRDPLSGRSYVYQAMRLTGAADPTVPIHTTLEGKLPQRKITQDAARGYSSYGNQIGISTGFVREVYHPGYVAKRLEIGAVVGAVKAAHVKRIEPEAGDMVLLIGGRTGRDGIGGATGSSVSHSAKSKALSGAEVQKGNPVVERKLQRLFRNPKFSLLIKRCNDFGAGGVAVAIGELADGITMNLDAVPKKYDGLNGTELAISESQERMAVVVSKKDVAQAISLAHFENIEATAVAVITDEAILRMTWQGEVIVDLPRQFLDTNGASQTADVTVELPKFIRDRKECAQGLEAQLKKQLSDLNGCSQKGLVSMFDSTIGSASILSPLGGKYQLSPEMGMAANIPTIEQTTTATVMASGINPVLGSWSPFHGAQFAIAEAMSRLVAIGGDVRDAWLSLQEYFPKLSTNAHWGMSLAAMLGALEAQIGLEVAAIGGKDSMSGTFGKYEVPPTLAAFALAPTDAALVTSATFALAGETVYHVAMPLNGYGCPDFAKWREILLKVHALYERRQISHATVVSDGSIIKAVTQSLFGNMLGFCADASINEEQLLSGVCGDLLLVSGADINHQGLGWNKLGVITTEPQLKWCNNSVELSTLLEVWQRPLSEIFPIKPANSKTEGMINELETQPITAECELPKTAVPIHHQQRKPVCAILVFPGTNCEYDTAYALRKAGADVQEILIRNRDEADLRNSLYQVTHALTQAQIVALPGGFSAGDEPEGSAKFITSVLAEESVALALATFLARHDTLIIGICNGFQALLKSGLLPYGKLVLPQNHDAPTLAMNTIGKHLSQYVTTEVITTKSPWLRLQRIGERHVVPISHGEGRLVAPQAELKKLINCNQVAFRYVDPNTDQLCGELTSPNGSMFGIEGIINSDGRILGKMAHTERVRRFVGKNIPDIAPQKIFRAGVTWLTGEAE